MWSPSYEALSAALLKISATAGVLTASVVLTSDTAPAFQLADWLGTKPPIVAGAVGGAVIFFLVGKWSFIDGLRRALASGLFAYLGASGLIELGFKSVVTSVETERLFALICGVIGVIIVEALLSFFGALRDRSSVIAERAIEKYAGLQDDKK